MDSAKSVYNGHYSPFVTGDGELHQIVCFAYATYGWEMEMDSIVRVTKRSTRRIPFVVRKVATPPYFYVTCEGNLPCRGLHICVTDTKQGFLPQAIQNPTGQARVSSFPLQLFSTFLSNRFQSYLECFYFEHDHFANLVLCMTNEYQIRGFPGGVLRPTLLYHYALDTHFLASQTSNNLDPEFLALLLLRSLTLLQS
jgi:hypothetical protein